MGLLKQVEGLALIRTEATPSSETEVIEKIVMRRYRNDT